MLWLIRFLFLAVLKTKVRKLRIHFLMLVWTVCQFKRLKCDLLRHDRYMKCEKSSFDFGIHESHQCERLVSWKASLQLLQTLTKPPNVSTAALSRCDCSYWRRVERWRELFRFMTCNNRSVLACDRMMACTDFESCSRKVLLKMYLSNLLKQ